MSITGRYVKNILIIEITDEIFGQLCRNTDDFLDEIKNANTRGSKIIAFDLSKKTFLNSTGLADLIRIKNSLLDEGTELILINPAKRVMSLFKMMSVLDFFTIVDSENRL